MHVGLPLLCHSVSPHSSVTSLTHTDIPGACDRKGGINTEEAGEGWGGVAGKGVVSGVGRIWGLTQADGGGGEQSVLYSHSLNPLWNRSMKWHSPVQKRKVKRQLMKEDIAVSISALTPRSGKQERVMVIFNHTVQHENIISITEHRSSVMWNDMRR